MDHVSKCVRSKIMSLVRSKGNRTTEAALGKRLWAAGLRGYRKQWPVRGKPDFAWPRLKLADFVDGCFWHGCPCKKLPRENRGFWRKKIAANQLRDRRVSQFLRKLGWSVIRIRECKVHAEASLRRIVNILEVRRSLTPPSADTNRAPSTHRAGGSRRAGR